MKIRTYTEADLDQIKKIYDQGLHGFDFPAIDERIVVRRCFVDSKDRVRMAAFGRAQLNALLFVDSTWETPQERLEVIEVLEAAMIEEAQEKGFDQVTAQVSPRFGRRLKQLGWNPSFGETWHKLF